MLCHERPAVIRAAFSVSFLLAAMWPGLTANENWHTKWRRVRLTADEEAKAKADMKTVIEWPGTAKDHTEQQAKQEKADRYVPLSFGEKKYGARYAPLCRIAVAKLKQGADLDKQRLRTSVEKFCSCSFVRPDVLMTAAHCFLPPDGNWKGTGQGKPADIRPATGWLIYVVQAYGGEAAGKYAEYTLKHAQVVVEWWTPEVYTGNESDVFKNVYADVAFGKVRNENEQQARRPVYALWELRGKLPSQPPSPYDMFDEDVLMMQLGYPAAYKDTEMPVQITGQVKRTGNDVAFIGRATRETKKSSLLKLLQANTRKQVDEQKDITGNMGVGGSGGPIIIANACVGDASSDLLYMAVFGVSSAGPEDSENDPTRRSYAARIRADMIEALEQIAKLKLDFAAPQAVSGVAKATVTAVPNVEKVELELPQAAKRNAKKGKS